MQFERSAKDVVAGKDEGDAGLSAGAEAKHATARIAAVGDGRDDLRERNEVTNCGGYLEYVCVACEDELHEAEEAAQNKGHWEMDPAGVESKWGLR